MHNYLTRAILVNIYVLQNACFTFVTWQTYNVLMNVS